MAGNLSKRRSNRIKTLTFQEGEKVYNRLVTCSSKEVT
jgi:hypothetical protein